MKKNIILIGMRGSGKSTIGKHLADKLSMAFIETDDCIEKKEGLTTRDIVTQYGWPHFRKTEKEIIESLKNCNNTVIATGGGAIIDNQNREILKQMGLVIWLKAPVDILLQRIGNDQNRPSLTGLSGKADMQKTWQERLPSYEKMADLTIDTTANMSQILNAIYANIKNEVQHD